MGTTTRILALFVLVVAGLLAVEGWWSVRRETRVYEADLRVRLEILADVVAHLVESVAASEGIDEAMHVVAELDREHGAVSIRWLPLTPTPNALAEAGTGVPGVGRSTTVADRQSEELVTYRRLAVAVGGLLEVRESLSEPVRMRRAKMVSAVAVTAALALLAAASIYPVGRVLLGRPLERLVELAERVGGGDLSVRAGKLHQSELKRLGVAFDHMTEGLARARDQLASESEARVRAVEQLRHQDRLRTVGKLAAGLAHELGTPLNVVSGRADLIARGRLDQEGVIESARTIKEQAGHMTEVIRQLLGFARQGLPSKRGLELVALVEDAVRLLAPVVREAGATVSVEADGPLEIEADETQLRQVLTNLIDNAVEAMPQGGSVRVVVGTFERRHPETGEPETGARVSVSDDGVGIPAADLDHVFEPFFTTKDIGQGTGLGLSIAYGIVQEHGGWFEVDSVVGEGATFTVYFPGPAS